MSYPDDPDLRRVITTAATAEVNARRPAICGTVVLHCLDHGEPLRLSLSMMDALLLLNSLQEIETEFELGEWTARLAEGNATALDRVAALERMTAGFNSVGSEPADDDAEQTPTPTSSVVN